MQEIMKLPLSRMIHSNNCITVSGSIRKSCYRSVRAVPENNVQGGETALRKSRHRVLGVSKKILHRVLGSRTPFLSSPCLKTAQGVGGPGKNPAQGVGVIFGVQSHPPVRYFLEQPSADM